MQRRRLLLLGGEQWRTVTSLETVLEYERCTEYIYASGELLKNVGEKRVQVRTQDGGRCPNRM